VGGLYAIAVRVETTAAVRARATGDSPAEASAHERAEELAAHYARIADPGRWSGAPPPQVSANLALVQAELAEARGDGDPGLWAVAVEALDVALNVPAATAARLRQAELLLAAGDRADAGELVLRAHTTAAESGLLALREAAATLARRARIPLEAERPGAGPEDPFGLTPREREVLVLVADGRTNRQIGEQLFMSEKTASVHVSRILAKLDVSSRGEAGALAHRLGMDGA
jgi:DNA-binding CsgD family transcriptional regulator